ncbi:alpha/beta hydrolase [Kutzneria viridogrisea]|uniref:AB hydrolase-1 domain-containing protein n=2 Tax=Kutzneria TaxID=43356 RepID=W5WFT2_9PSEU|nr:alpha/beta hydrolase [Kutzneria albida]AHH99677.1 hypothetical protein KALB_6317 [Kutzneria albida DSM 43870]MBA8924853.1 pimeloyl-ACP methyl ester carboxylesterase [Kutzneria viridogrisea]
MTHSVRTSDGAELAVRDSGGDRDTTVLLLHGWTNDHTVWDRVSELLAPHARVLRYDHRGHGRSTPGPRGSATLERAAEDLAEVITSQVPTGRLVLVGHSMGAMTMMALAELRPDLVAGRVNGAVFVSTSSGGLREETFGLPAPLVRLARRRRRPQRGGPSTGSRRTPKRPNAVRRLGSLIGVRWVAFGQSPARQDVRAAAAQLAAAHKGSLAGFQHAMNRHERTGALAGYGSVPTAVLVGQRDRLTPVRHARVIAAELPRGEFVLYHRAGHMLPYERATEVAARIVSTIRRSTV